MFLIFIEDSLLRFERFLMLTKTGDEKGYPSFLTKIKLLLINYRLYRFIDIFWFYTGI